MTLAKRKILIIAAHPDDEVLGCGGTIARLAQEGNEVYTLILGEGITSRDDQRNCEKNSAALEALKGDADKANSILGVKALTMFNLPDNRFDTVPMLDIVKTIEREIVKTAPDTVYTHYSQDLNIDHRITYNAVLTACRPKEESSVKKIYSFEIPSSTECSYPCTFSPNVFVDINKTKDKKLEALKAYKSELMNMPHPRSEEYVTSLAIVRGGASGLKFAEAFEAIRIIEKGGV